MINMMSMMFLLIGVLFGMTPFLIPQSIMFGVTLPIDVLNKKEVTQAKKRYSLINMGLGFVLSLISLRLFHLPSIDEQQFTIWFLIFIILQLLVASGMYFYNYQQMLLIKKKALEHGDTTSSTIPIDLNFRKKLNMVPTSLIVISQLIIIGMTLYMTISHLDMIPKEIIMQWGFDGEPNRIVPKSWSSIYSLIIVQIFVMVTLVIANEAFKKGKQRVTGVISAKNSQKYRRMSSYLNLVMGILIQTLFLAIQLTSVVPFLTYVTLEKFIFIDLFILFAVIIGTMFFYGQSGSRLNHDKSKDQYYDDDKFWKLGVFYYNPQDPSVWVEKRMGFGLTVNFASWKSWVFIIGIILFSILLVFITT